MSQITPLGEAPRAFGHTFERAHVLIETGPHDGTFIRPLFPILGWRVLFGACDGLATAEIEIGLARDPETYASLPGVSDAAQRDWQLYDGGSQFLNPEDVLGGGRRVRISTQRQVAADNWVIFEGFIDRIERGWSGSVAGRARTLRIFCNSTIMAADREANQWMLGQWRRTRASTIAMLAGAVDNRCIQVTAVPPIFNPGGVGNCSVYPLELGSSAGNDGVVHVFGDAIARQVADAIPWNVARILRYLQWAALQPAIPFPADPVYPYSEPLPESHQSPISLLPWTTFDLAHTRGRYTTASNDPTIAGPNLDALIQPYLRRTDLGSPDSPLDRVMLRMPTNLSVHGMSALEAITHVCDQIGLLFHIEHDTATNGNVHTYLRFTVRGHRCTMGQAPGGLDDSIVVSPAGGHTGGALHSSVDNCSARGVYLYVSSDGDRSDAPDAATAFRKDGPTEGSIVQDISGEARRVLVMGNPTEYELCTPPNTSSGNALGLLPGWIPNPDWDINPNDEPAVQAALAQIYSETWQRRYGAARTSLEFMEVGRLWVLNEDGSFAADFYKRTHGPWNVAASWAPFGFATRGGITELAARGDNNWSMRRRTFRPLIARSLGGDSVMRPEVQLSADSGVTWQSAEAVCAECHAEGDRLGIRFVGAALERVMIGNVSFVEAYLRGRLRVRVIANVEGDDALRAWSQSRDGAALPFVNVLHRPLNRKMRYRPGTAQPIAAENPLITFAPYANYVYGANQDQHVEARLLAERAAAELSVSRFTGSCTVPWLWRNGRGPVEGYRIGDEVLGLWTSDAETFWSFTPGRSPTEAGPRIVSIAYAYSDAEMSTTIALEDAQFDSGAASDAVAAVSAAIGAWGG